MSELDTLSNRLRLAREARGLTTTRRYRKRRTQPSISDTKRVELMQNITICREAKLQADADLDAVILVSYKKGLSKADIAKALNTSVGAVYDRIDRIKKRARRHVSTSAVVSPHDVEEV